MPRKRRVLKPTPVPVPVVTAPRLSSDGGVMPARLTWTAASKTGTTVSGYRPREAGVVLASLGSGVLTFTDDTATSGTAYDVVADFADGTSITSAEVTYSNAAGWNGWDPASTTSPPDLASKTAWHTNTGVWDATERAALTVVNGNMTSSANDQVITGLHIKGTLTISHTNVIVKRCWVEPTNAIGILSSVAPGSTSPRVWHCDIGNGAAGDWIADGTKGFFREIKRCNVFGWNDAFGAKSTIGYTNEHMLIRDNYVHDLREASDASFGVGENTHNDVFQLSHVRYQDVLNNTCVGWAMDNYTGTDSCTRVSGPNWTPGAGPLDFTGVLNGSGLAADGYMTSCYQGSDQLQQFVVIDGNVMRGHFANTAVLRGATANSYTVTNNTVQRNANLLSSGSRRNVISFLSGATATLSGNVDVDGATINA